MRVAAAPRRLRMRGVRRPSHEYHFVTYWRVEAAREEVFAVLTDSESLTRWWPSVYRRVQPIGPPPGPDGVGKRLLLDTQGWLPYRLCWELRTVEHQPPSRLALEASGDFVGSGVWTLTEDGGATELQYEWAIRAHKPLLRYLSILLPLEARVRTEPSLGDGARTRESRARARTQARQAGRGAAWARERAVVGLGAHECPGGARSGASRHAVTALLHGRRLRILQSSTT